MKPLSKQIILLEGASYDPDAVKFFLAAGIVSNPEKKAINNLVVNLKLYNLWGKMVAIYPFIGGTAGSHKYNLKDPRDLDAAFRLTFHGAATHNISGVTFGVNGYAKTQLQPSVSLSLNNSHLSNYHTTNTDGGYISGCHEGGKYFHERTLSTSVENACNGAFTFLTPTYTSGFFIHSRITNTSWQRFERGVKTNIVTASNALSALVYPLSCVNTGAFGFYSKANLRLSSLGTGFSDSEANDYTNIVQAYQTELNRAIT